MHRHYKQLQAQYNDSLPLGKHITKSSSVSGPEGSCTDNPATKTPQYWHDHRPSVADTVSLAQPQLCSTSHWSWTRDNTRQCGNSLNVREHLNCVFNPSVSHLTPCPTDQPCSTSTKYRDMWWVNLRGGGRSTQQRVMNFFKSNPRDTGTVSVQHDHHHSQLPACEDRGKALLAGLTPRHDKPVDGVGCTGVGCGLVFGHDGGEETGSCITKL